MEPATPNADFARLAAVGSDTGSAEQDAVLVSKQRHPNYNERLLLLPGPGCLPSVPFTRPPK